MTTSGEFLESTHDGARKVSRVTKVISASAQDIFDLLANPAMHSVIDGSDSVLSARDSAPTRLTLGAKFGMSMKVGVPYKITNEVVEFVEGSQIAWRHFGGHIWRYILKPVAGASEDSAATEVTEEFDYAKARSPFFLKLAGYPDKNRKSMEKTLVRMQAHFTNK